MFSNSHCKQERRDITPFLQRAQCLPRHTHCLCHFLLSPIALLAPIGDKILDGVVHNVLCTYHYVKYSLHKYYVKSSLQTNMSTCGLSKRIEQKAFSRYSSSHQLPCVAQLVRAQSLYLCGPWFESRHTDKKSKSGWLALWLTNRILISLTLSPPQRLHRIKNPYSSSNISPFHIINTPIFFSVHHTIIMYLLHNLL